MAEETIVTPAAETIAPATPPEGSINSIVTPPAPAPKPEETVPLSVFLALKDDMKELKRELKERPQSTAEVNATIKAFTDKYPDTNPDAIADIIKIAVTEVEAKYTPIIERQENERKQQDFDTKFDVIFTKALAENPDVKDANKEVIKALALTPKYNNTPVAEIIREVYPTGTVGRTTTENEIRVSADTIEQIVDVDAITPAQRAQIMENPELRKAYFDKLDALGR